MKDITLFHKILFPIDFLSDDTKSIEYVINLASIFKAELIFLYTYRLITPTEGVDNVINAKKQTEEEANNKFQQIKNDLLVNVGIDYSFLCEVGFANDRLMSNVKSENIDLIVLTHKMKERIKNETKSFESHIIDQIPCPLVLLPKTL